MGKGWLTATKFSDFHIFNHLDIPAGRPCRLQFSFETLYRVLTMDVLLNGLSI